jgi:hypothetical protein
VTLGPPNYQIGPKLEELISVFFIDMSSSEEEQFGNLRPRLCSPSYTTQGSGGPWVLESSSKRDDCRARDSLRQQKIRSQMMGFSWAPSNAKIAFPILIGFEEFPST